MTLKQVLTASAITCYCLTFFSGCGSSSDDRSAKESQDAESPAVVQSLPEESSAGGEEKESPMKLRAVLSTWDSGDKDASVRQLLQVHWDDPTAFADMPILEITEQNFSATGAGERAGLQGEAMNLASTAKSILRHAFVLAEQHEAAGEKQEAKKCYEGVRNLGKALTNPDRLAVLQMMGKGLVEMSEEKLEAVD